MIEFSGLLWKNLTKYKTVFPLALLNVMPFVKVLWKQASFYPTFFSFYCGYLDNDQTQALPKLLSLSLRPSLSVYLPPNEEADSSGCPFKRNGNAQNLRIAMC